jgi:putative transposase
LTFSPKTGPADKLVFWHNKILLKGEFAMKKKFTEEQIAFALKQAEHGTPVVEVIRKMGITEQTYYRWKKKYGGLGMSELRRLKQLEEENRKLKQMVADLSLDKYMLQDVLSKKL